MTLDVPAAIARSVGRAVRVAGRGGTSLPGKLLLRMDSGAITRLAGGLSDGSVLVSATNGKTTTAALAASIFEAAGIPTVHNVAGANMAGGVASALLERDTLARLGLFEVDEFWLDELAAAIAPRAILLGNLFRDQLDRYGELETIAERWAALIAARPTQLVLNADDPLVADLGRGHPDTLYFGIDDPAAARDGGLAHASDSKLCRNCGAAYRYAHVYIAHLGEYACPNCGRRRPPPSVSAGSVALDGLRGASFELRTPLGTIAARIALPGLYNVYNALGAAALASALGIEPATIAAGLAATAPVFGRGERVTLDGRELVILLIKNPAGANEVLRMLGAQDGAHDVLGILNDRIADGRDVSWIWDADFETLAARVRHATCAGSRAAELALRLKYAGVPDERITVTAELEPALAGALAQGRGELYALPTYTAMLALRELLTRRGAAPSSWARG
ncbi:MAG TPA: MurT ligase domain-containing protein [Solirubrobacteraceae bacterium]|nr:MurT ligase domain-containing protein [Solirubrobacteraceae bacterium]